MQQPEKRCTHCGETKSLDEFTKHPRTRDRRGSWCKRCTCEAARQIREERPEQVRAASADWYRRNSDKVRATSKARYMGNREQLVLEESRRRAARKAKGIKPYRSAASIERGRAWNRRWAQRNTESINAYHRAYYAVQPGKVRGWQHKRRALIQGAGGSFTNAEWLALCEQYRQRCLACGEERPLTVDHVIPLSRGGPNTINNIQPLCKPCNSRKRTRTIDFRLAEANTWR